MKFKRETTVQRTSHVGGIAQKKSQTGKNYTIQENQVIMHTFKGKL